ncbi:unnamed protein product, partial [Didymodactylos carnosus]
LSGNSNEHQSRISHIYYPPVSNKNKRHITDALPSHNNQPINNQFTSAGTDSFVTSSTVHSYVTDKEEVDSQKSSTCFHDNSSQQQIRYHVHNHRQAPIRCTPKRYISSFKTLVNATNGKNPQKLSYINDSVIILKLSKERKLFKE